MADSGMPEFKEVNWEQQEREDEAALQNLLDMKPGESNGIFDENRPLDAGEKADDAEDYEDISDDDLPDEEEATGGKDDEAPGLTDDVDMGLDDDDDDLFGDNQAATPYDHFDGDGMFPHDTEIEPHTNGDLALQSVEPVDEVEDLRALNFPGHGTIVQDDTPADYEGDDEFIRQNFPTFDKDSVANNLNELLPPRYAHFIPKVPVKPPKQVNPTKVSLDLAGDQEKTYRAAGVAKFDKSKWVVEAESKGLVPIVEESSSEAESENEFDFTPLDRTEKVGGLSMMDIEIACADWESMIDRQMPTPPVELEDEGPLDDWDREILGHSSKRKRVQDDEFVIGPIYPTPSFDNFEEMAAQVAKRVEMDMNDPYLLLDVQEPQPPTKRRRLGVLGKKTANGNLGWSLSARFNMSNDEAYEALKENHQSKVRATLGNIAIEHSLPAQKLQWPYYLLALDPRFIRSHHRPAFTVLPRTMNTAVGFSKPGMRKKKTLKGMPTTEIFKETGDLSLSEHYSTATLLEYSEEYPTMLSNFGMGNRIINYYRRKDANDQERPMPDDRVGDVTVLLPEDKSPFSNFGFVDPGETVRAIHNAMYRAPIFKHEPEHTDFLVIRTQTGLGGANWHIRNIDNIFTVGQQFPSVDIPGPHSRKVTNAQKSRMKMIAYRKIRHSEKQHLKIGEITRHVPNSVDMQNRQKLKEFMTYDKAEKVWRMRSGDVMPDEATIRSMVKPEDVCLIDSMQVGLKQLEDAGYKDDKDQEVLDDEEGAIDKQLAPWNTSKAFSEASADKAMLKLHGEGDPTGRGSGFSFIKTSMKGGYLDAIQHGPMSSSAARVAKDPKANNGHTYNVKAQQAIYNNNIRRIWDQQKSELSDHQPPELTAADMARFEERNAEVDASPADFDDDNASVASHSNRPGRVLKITRKIRGQLEPEIITIKDEKVIKKYVAIRNEQEMAKINATTWQPTGNAELDELGLAKAADELKRLKKNKERREHRESTKLGVNKGKKGKVAVENGDAASPSATPGPGGPAEKSAGTTRKCANCGLVGHIKTNKKYCDLCWSKPNAERIALGKAYKAGLESREKSP